jgi:hypothetical protein
MFKWESLNGAIESNWILALACLDKREHRGDDDLSRRFNDIINCIVSTPMANVSEIAVSFAVVRKDVKSMK